MVTAPEPVKERSGTIECDEVLFESLRELRKRLADDRSVPAYIIFSDVTLRHLARDYPKNLSELRRVPGVGEKKLAEFGDLFLSCIADHLRTQSPKKFEPEPPRPAPASRALNNTAGETLRLIDEGKSIEEIAALRDLTPGTIYQHIVTAIESGRAFEPSRFFNAQGEEEIRQVFAKIGFSNLTGAFEALSGHYTYGQLRIYRALMNRSGPVSPSMTLSGPP